MGRKRRASRQITIRVYADEDSDLIEMLESLSSGRRSEVIRAALRAYCQNAGELAAVKRDTQQILELLKRGINVAQVEAPESRIDEQATERRKGNLLEAGW